VEYREHTAADNNIEQATHTHCAIESLRTVKIVTIYYN